MGISHIAAPVQCLCAPLRKVWLHLLGTILLAGSDQQLDPALLPS